MRNNFLTRQTVNPYDKVSYVCIATDLDDSNVTHKNNFNYTRKRLDEHNFTDIKHQIANRQN